MIEIKRGLAPKTSKGLRVALQDLRPRKAFIAGLGAERYTVGHGIEVISFRELADQLCRLSRS